MKLYSTTPLHTECRDAMVNAMRPFEDRLSPMEMLAVAAQMVGQLIALQDQRQLTPDQAMDLVARNIAEGNASAIGALLGNPKGRA